MLQIFSRSVRKSNRILDIGFVTQDAGVGSALKEFVSHRDNIGLRLIESSHVVPGFDAGGLSIFVYDLDASSDTIKREFERFMAQRPQHLPVIVLSPAVDDDLVRWFLRLRVADWIKTPLSPGELISACGRAIDQPGSSRQEVKCLTFMGTRGGTGTTTLAIHAASLLSQKSAKSSKSRSTTTGIIDLDLNSSSCAEYLDLQPNWQLDEIIANPARLDAHMLEIMIAEHKQGLAVLSARRKYGERYTFSPEVVTRTLDLASQKYENLVIDLPRHAESWSDGVLLGSTEVYLVTDFSVPGIRAAKRIITDFAEQYAGEVVPKVIINKYNRSLFGSGLTQSDVKGLLRESLAGFVTADDKLVRESIDRGVLTTDIKSKNSLVTELSRILGG